MTSTVLYLEGPGTLLNAHFVVKSESIVRVKALTGVASYIDRDMTREEARKVWKNLISRGWKQVDEGRLTERQLTLMIYD